MGAGHPCGLVGFQGSRWFVRFPLAGELQCVSRSCPSGWEVQGWGSLSLPLCVSHRGEEENQGHQEQREPCVERGMRVSSPSCSSLCCTASAGTSQGLVQEGRFLTGVVKEGRGWWSHVPTRSSWRLEPGRTGGGLACQANRGGCGLGRSKCLSLFPPALSAWERVVRGSLACLVSLTQAILPAQSPPLSHRAPRCTRSSSGSCWPLALNQLPS